MAPVPIPSQITTVILPLKPLAGKPPDVANYLITYLAWIHPTSSALKLSTFSGNQENGEFYTYQLEITKPNKTTINALRLAVVKYNSKPAAGSDDDQIRLYYLQDENGKIRLKELHTARDETSKIFEENKWQDGGLNAVMSGIDIDLSGPFGAVVFNNMIRVYYKERSPNAGQEEFLKVAYNGGSVNGWTIKNAHTTKSLPAK